MELKYIYGIIQTDEELGFEAVGLGGSPVYTIAQQGLGCVLSDYSGEKLADISKEELVRRLLAHQAVVERVMGGHTVLPVKFGTLLASEVEVRHFLSQGQRRLADALARVQGKVEVEVAATWDTSRVLGELAHEPEIAQARETISGLPVGEALQQRVRLGQMVKEALDRRRDGYCRQMIAFLRPWALDVQPNALVSDQMVMNVAFLVDRAKEEEFDRHIQQLNDLFHDQFNFRIIGPLPPYSFSTVEVSRPNWEELEEAKRALSLGDVVSEPEVRGAYRNLAARYHSDLNPGDEAAKERFARLREASELLLAYCRGLGDPGGTEKGYPITRDAIERSFLIAIKRSASDEIESSRFGGLGGRA